MIFEWDQNKNKINVRKHNISFKQLTGKFGGTGWNQVEPFTVRRSLSITSGAAATPHGIARYARAFAGYPLANAPPDKARLTDNFRCRIEMRIAQTKRGRHPMARNGRPR